VGAAALVRHVPAGDADELKRPPRRRTGVVGEAPDPRTGVPDQSVAVSIADAIWNVGSAVKNECEGLIRIDPLDANAPAVDPEQVTAFRGTVKELFYQGNFSEITVVIKEAAKPLVVYLTRGAGPEHRLREGQEVVVSWESRRNNVLRK
jgi:hypothetical protein